MRSPPGLRVREVVLLRPGPLGFCAAPCTAGDADCPPGDLWARGIDPDWGRWIGLLIWGWSTYASSRRRARGLDPPMAVAPSISIDGDTAYIGGTLTWTT